MNSLLQKYIYKLHSIRNLPALFIILPMFCFTLYGISAEELGPRKLLQDKLNKIKEITNNLPENYTEKEKDKAKEDIKKELQNLIDKQYITKLSLGEKNWNIRSQEQKEEFQNLFQKLLIKKITAAAKKKKIPKSKKEKVKKLKSLQLKIIYEKKYTDSSFNIKDPVLVRTLIPGQKLQIPIDFLFYKSKNDSQESWKIYDILIDGRSTMWYYRKLFGRIIRKHGFSYLLKRLKLIVNKKN